MQQNTLKVIVTENEKQVEKLFIAMRLANANCGYEINGVVYVDHSVIERLSLPNNASTAFLKIVQPKFSIGDNIKSYLKIKSISVNYNGFVYCFNGPTGWVCMSEAQASSLNKNQ